MKKEKNKGTSSEDQKGKGRKTFEWYARGYHSKKGKGRPAKM